MNKASLKAGFLWLALIPIVKPLIKGLSGAADGFQSSGIVDGIVTLGELRSYMNSAMPDETQKVLGVAKRPVITTSTGDPDIWNLTLQVK